MNNDLTALQNALRGLQRDSPFSSHSLGIERMIDELTRHQRLLTPAMQIQQMFERMQPLVGLTDIISPALRHNLQNQVIGDVFAKLNTSTHFSTLLENNPSGLSSVFAKLGDQQRVFAEILKPHLSLAHDLPLGIAAAVDASSVWQTSIDSMMSQFRGIGLLGVRDDLIDRLLSPSRAYAAFAETATARLNDSLSPSRLLAVNASFKLIDFQYETIAAALSSLPAPTDSEAVWEDRLLAAPMAQFEAAFDLEIEERSEEVDQRIIEIPTIACAEDAKVIVGLVCRANEITMSLGKGEFFKPTTRFVEACADVSWIVAEDKQHFGNLIDCLYFIFYEGAGKDNLRYLSKNGGPMTPDEADFVWCLKHLRNKYARHDPDHGKSTDITRSWSDLQQKWVALGLTNAPYRRDDFLAAQRALIRMGRAFMESLLERLASSGAQ